MWMVNDELDVQHVIFTLLQEKDPGQDPGQTRGKIMSLVEGGLDCLPVGIQDTVSGSN